MLPVDRIMEERIGCYIDGLSLFESQHPAGKKILSIVRSMNGMNIPNPQHLYILSDEEIKEGDFCYSERDKSVYKSQFSEFDNATNYVWKIIATTNSSLSQFKWEIKSYQMGNKIIPTIPQPFIQFYIQEYNKGKAPVDVEVEYERIEPFKQTISREFDEDDVRYELVINPDNTINIKPTKECWTREDVAELIARFDIAMGKDIPAERLNKWIEENL